MYKMWLDDFQHWFEQLQQQTLLRRQRQLVVLVGEPHWAKSILNLQAGHKTAEKLPAANSENSHLSSPWQVYSTHDNIATTIDHKHYQQELGGEHSVIFFADAGLNLDAFAALSGTLVAGGVMLLYLDKSHLVTEGKSDKCSFRYFFRQLKQKHDILWLEQDNQLVNLTQFFAPQRFAAAEEQTLSANKPLSWLCKTLDQQTAVEHICKVSTGHRNRPLVLTADRGRGKSSALAIACGQLITQQVSATHATKPLAQHIIITAGHRRATEIFFKQLAISLPNAEINGAKVHYQGSIIEFVALDQLLKNPPKPSLVLVDEAAAIPVYLLTALVQQYHRIVFSSTVHGYEGAGRGFTLKFQQKLQQLAPQWRHFHLNEPIRWRKDDPLERFVFDSCLLNAALPLMNETNNANDLAEGNIGALEIDNHALAFIELLPEQLSADKTLMTQVFSVLVIAHYQTSPSDISLILDNNAVSLQVIKYRHTIIGVCLLLREGSSNQTEVEAVENNQRRLKNQFLPQSLLTHCGFKESFDYQYLRILRIAIHPSYHGQGLGRLFLAHLDRFAQQQQVDFIGSSFGANAQLLNFWQSSGYQVARIGFSQDKSSGEHSAMVIKAVSKRCELFAQRIVEVFYGSFDYLLTDEYQELSSDLVWQILHHCPEELLPVLTDHELTSVNDFILTKRQYSACVPALHKWCLRHFKQEFSPGCLILIARVLQKRTIEYVCQHYQFTGRKTLNIELVNFIRVNHNQAR